MPAYSLASLKPGLALLTLSLALTACQSAPPTALETALNQRPIPADAEALSAECRELAELYATSLVALTTWNDARTPNRLDEGELQRAMTAARSRAERIGCPAFWAVD